MKRRERPVALVTGGATRIGKAITQALLQADYAGFHVIIQYWAGDLAAEELCLRYGKENCSMIYADLQDMASLKDMAKKVMRRHKKIDLLVNNAALMMAPVKLENITENQWIIMNNLNIKAPLFLAKELHAALAGGSIVNIGDVAGLLQWPSNIVYSMTKANLFAMTKMLAKVMAPGARVNALALGPILPRPEQAQIDIDRMLESVPLGRMGTSEDVARAVVFLAQSPYITGAILPVDGGRLVS